MQQALEQAKLGAGKEEVPVGALLVHDGKVIGQGYNAPISRHDATAHAEIVAIRNACQNIHNYRLPENTTLYVTLEPCTMCMGALIHARVKRVVYATQEPRAGMLGSQLNLAKQPFYNHRIDVQHGLYQAKSAHLLQSFFRSRRANKKRMAEVRAGSNGA
ncbi:tRNA adenosine(34) deaminase TadA [Psychrobacter aestuarii]|uniref:tRNA-specific adenosine deaminase n=2 Tax=Psychrobacter aestuarii TaxID=556327 RepID=A0ABP3FM39_9GAMM